MTTAERAEMDILIAATQTETRAQADLEYGLDMATVMLIATADDAAFESYLDSTAEDAELDDVLAMLDDTDDLIECLDV